MSRPEPAGTVLTRLRVPEDHPALPGHFPGRPVVPGVLLLDAVLDALRKAGAGPATRLLRAKFLAPVAPGMEVAITLAETGAHSGHFAFTCHAEGRVVARGEVACGTPQPEP
jgi:3-hydroxymyristoyl/3-hydroxydecanoyl-(acyl carrier protein) dehydratase